jgi:hypothetical protein
MAKRDPFGRLPDENPLAGLGVLSDGTTSQAGEPVVVAADDDWSGGEPGTATARPAQDMPETRDRAAGRPADRPAMSASSATRPPRPASSPTVEDSIAEVIRQAESLSGHKVVQSVQVAGRVVKLVVFLIVIGVVFGVGSSIWDAGNDVRDAFDDIPSRDNVAPPPSFPGATGGEERSEPKVPTGLSSNSMLTRRNFSRAMNRLSKAGLGRMRSMSVRPERIDAQLLTRGGSLRSVQIKSGESEITSFGASGGGFSQRETIPFAKINSAAPSRLARSAAGRLRRPVSQIDYVVLVSFAGTPTWAAFSKGKLRFQADTRGRITRRVN